MAWLAIDRKGRETISRDKPTFDGVEWDCEAEIYIEGEHGITFTAISIPNGTIEKILGRKLTHEESPIEIK